MRTSHVSSHGETMFAQASQWMQAEAHAFKQAAVNLPPEAGTAIQYASTVAVLGCAVALFVNLGSVKHSSVIVACMLLPISMFCVMISQPTFYGQADTRCTEYNGGKLTYQLVQVAEEPADQRNVYGDTQLLIIVLAPEKWGNDTHLCRFSPNDPNVKGLRSSLKRIMRETHWEDGGEERQRNKIFFSFAGGIDGHNVTFSRKGPYPDKGSPELPADKI